MRRYSVTRGGLRSGQERAARRTASRILIVETDEPFRRTLAAALATRNYQALTARDAKEAVQLSIHHDPDLIVMAQNIGGSDGLTLCQQMRQWNQVPILVLSPSASREAHIRALDVGADDFMSVRPFSSDEFLARVRALLRRPRRMDGARDPIVHLQELVIDLVYRRVTSRGDRVPLTPTEYEILAFLTRNANQVMTCRMIQEHVWGPSVPEDPHILRVHIGNLRKKLWPDASAPCCIVTEPHLGYRLVTR